MKAKYLKLLIFLLLLWATIASLLLFSQPRNQSSISIFPHKLGDMVLTEEYSGQKAISEIESLHGSKFGMVDGYVAHYKSASREAKLWVSLFGSEIEALDSANKMTGRIGEGTSEFSPPQNVTFDGVEMIQVYHTESQGQHHYYWAKRNLVIWVSLDGFTYEESLDLAKQAVILVG